MPRTRARTLAGTVALTAALVAAGCGGGGGGGSDSLVSASYYVYFTRGQDAREAAGELRKSGYRTEVREGDGVEWLVVASRKVPRGDLDGAEGEMRYVAYQFSGDYDGLEIESDD
ncbi:MAG: ribonuclease E inhibitor RraB [Gaiellaceae bacterium]